MTLASPAAFFSHVRKGILRLTLTPEEGKSCETSLAAMSRADLPLSWATYGLATKLHETTATMQPIK